MANIEESPAWDFIDSPKMPPPFEWSIQEHNQYFVELVLTQKPSGKREHIGIIVSACIECNLRCPAQSSPDSLMLIHRHIDTIPGSADGDAGIAFPFLDG